MVLYVIYPLLLCIVGILGTYYFTKWQMMNHQIIHYFIKSYEIGKGLTDDFPQFQLHYGPEVLSNNVNVLQGGFINSGKKDIGENSEETPLKLMLPEGCVVKALNISPLTKGLVVKQSDDKTSISENEIVFIIEGLMKPNECFDYSAIIEAPEDISYFDIIRFEHRIKDTDIKNLYVGEDNSLSTLSGRRFHIAVLLFAILFLGLLMLSVDLDQFLSELNKPGSWIVILSALISLLSLMVISITNIFGQRNHIVYVLNKIRNKGKVRNR